MSSPTHSTFQPGSVGQSIAKLVFPHALGKAAAIYFFSPAGLVMPRICEKIQGRQTLLIGNHRQTFGQVPSFEIHRFFSFNFVPAYVLQATPLLWQDVKQCGEQSTSSPAGSFLHSRYRTTQFAFGLGCEQ